MLEFLSIRGCLNARTGSAPGVKHPVCLRTAQLTAGHRKEEEAVFSIIGFHLQVTCSVLSSAKLQWKVVMAQQIQSFVRLGTVL